MRARYKAPTGTGIIELPDDATVSDIFSEIRTETGIPIFALKYGWPLQTLGEQDLGASPASLLNLNGQSFTLVPAAEDAPARPPSPVSAPPPSGNRAPLPSAQSPQDITVPWPEREGTLLLRVMPSDNSCLFTAFGGIFPTPIPPLDMRIRVAEHILSDPEEWTEAKLNMKPDQYCQKITTPEYWGGAIELSIFANMFDVEICTFDVSSETLMRFGEDVLRQTRCVLVYSGVHYDRVVFSASDPPYRTSNLPPELDRTLWETADDQVLEKAAELVAQLRDIHYYVDANELLLRCDHPGCDWLGSGQIQGQKHARETGHGSLTEIQDSGQYR